MIEWYKDLYMDSITKKTADVWRRLSDKEVLQYPVFCVTLSTNPSNLLDIINVNELLFPYYKDKQIFIVGVASSREQAKIMAAAIVTKVYETTGGFDVRAYFGKNFGERL